ncbi:F0F1 ATP synthase subunit B [Candidatus Uhrbacteria bacterium]|nr:F0F1 ATP synthase subunit B [Candidatus Uhrbacteria bacterium]
MSTEASVIQEATTAVEQTGGIAALGINGKLFLAQLINFLVVLLVFWKWIYGPIVKMLDRRTETIERGLAHTAELEERLKKVEMERAGIVAQAQAAASNLLEEARTERAARHQSAAEETKRAVASIVQEGKHRLGQEKERMIEEVRAELADIVVEATRKVLGESMDEQRSSALAEEALRTVKGV